MMAKNATRNSQFGCPLQINGKITDSTGRVPGTWVKQAADSKNLSAAGSNDDAALLAILVENKGRGQDYDEAYSQNASAIAEIPNAGEFYTVNASAATYTNNQALMVGASGFVLPATTGSSVVAYVSDDAKTVSATDVTNGTNKLSVRIADRVKM